MHKQILPLPECQPPGAFREGQTDHHVNFQHIARQCLADLDNSPSPSPNPALISKTLEFRAPEHRYGGDTIEKAKQMQDVYQQRIHNVSCQVFIRGEVAFQSLINSKL